MCIIETLDMIPNVLRVQRARTRHCTLKGYTESNFIPDKQNKPAASGFILENSKFILSDLSKQSKLSDKEKFAIVYLMSDLKTGLLREICDFVNLGLFEIDGNGALKLAEDWEEKVPAFVVVDLVEEGWSSDVDPFNKFCIHPIIRKGIDSKWKRSSLGWELTSSSKSVSLIEEDYIRLRQTFMDKFEDYEATGAGVHQFGV